ncbi:putative peptidase family-domain-containing protein [Aspergillus varians]
MTKRPIDPVDSAPPAPRRVKPTPIEKRPFRITNFSDGEVVHQTCVSIHGEGQIFSPADETTFISVSATDAFNQTRPGTHWPLYKGQWKALAMLAPGVNRITLELHHAGGTQNAVSITLNYVPLLQLPPLHLAILVAKDSPLLIDCPPAKYGAVSTAHSGIDAAVAKFRMAAYMWQAVTAEGFREKGLGRRTFRLDEEWGSNTAMQMVHHQGNLGGGGGGEGLTTVAKVHIIRSEKSLAEIRSAQVAQQNTRARDREALHRYFEAALMRSGIPGFESRCRPVVAGMVLDAHYSAEDDMILGHAALGCHKADGLSLGIFGSHLTYSWPRFLEEVPACLTDLTPTGDTVGNDNGECGTMRGACFVGQGAFLHEVGHAFGAGHTTGIMARGYSKAWAVNFVEHERNDRLARDDPKWDLRDLLKFKVLPHFALPGDDLPVPVELRDAAVRIESDVDSDGDEVLRVSCKAGLAQVTIQSGDDRPRDQFKDAAWKEGTCTAFHMNPTIEDLDRSKPLKVTALGMNGKERVVKDAWVVLKELPYISIPGSQVKLRKQSVNSNRFDGASDDDGNDFISWTVLLRHSGKDGQLYRATSIDLRVGCTMDGAVVYYADDRHENCGPARNAHTGQPHRFGGHASETHDLPEGETIAKVMVCKDDNGWGSLAGIRMTLSNGETWGCLNNDQHYEDGEDDQDDDAKNNSQDEETVVTLEPGEDEVVVGFYGQSAADSGFTYQFGILTAPKGVELPETVYGMSGLSNAS